MLTCPNPSCQKELPALSRTCRHCKADLSLLVDYTENLQDALDRADYATRAGKLGEAVWAYLEVLEVDPDNVAARRQVGQVATAVRQFDRAAPGRRWLSRLRDEALYTGERDVVAGWLKVAAVALLVLAAFLFGYQWGLNGE
jgi:hypothetical protein